MTGPGNSPITATVLCRNCDAEISVLAELCPACGVRQYEGSSKALAGLSEKRTGAAAILAFFFGVFGVHRFYLGRPKSAILQLLTLGGLGVWAMVDFVLILFGELKDGEGRRLKELI
ncbi:MAG TPA: TM2 domain-containing protein [Gemmatimonadaceae bacterium]|nr:TM2 domain-containing protein [Gemmatimonadaceae bacterium]